MKTLLVALFVCGFPALALAHPGHGTTDPSSWRHYLTEPIHLAVIASALALVVTTFFEVRRAKRIKT